MYTIAQLIGAAVGAAVFNHMTPLGAAVARCTVGEMKTSGAFASEFFFSVTLLFIAFGTAFDLKQGAVFGICSTVCHNWDAGVLFQFIRSMTRLIE